MKNKFNPKNIILIFLFFFSNISINGQEKISLAMALEKAYQNNLAIKGGQLKIDYQEKIKKSYFNIDPLNLNAEIGQFNSEKTDNKFSVSQNFKFPGYYKHQKQVLLEEWKLANTNQKLQKWELKKELSLVYNELLYQEEKRKLLKKVDSLFGKYYEKANLRLKKGESNILEKTTAENYKAQVGLQLNALNTDNVASLEKLNFIIQSKEQYNLENQDFYHFFSESFTNNFAGNPLILEQLEQQKAIENAKLNSEKSKLLPSISLGINSMTMAGNSNNNSRFQSGMFGIALPIFNSGQKSIIEGQKINQQIAENNQKISKKNMEIQYSLLQNEYKKLKAEQEYYLTKGLKNGEVILQTAHQQFYGGEINYLEWSILVNQSLEINNKYIDNQKLLNDKIIEINSLEEKL